MNDAMQVGAEQVLTVVRGYTVPADWRLEREAERGTWAVFAANGVAVSRTAFGAEEAARRAHVEFTDDRRWWEHCATA
jgi:hypothetical protein